jgi:hypothetical protein
MTRANQPDLSASPDPRANTVIDAALRSVGTATPASDLQGRILTRLAAERMNREVAAPLSPLFGRRASIVRTAAPVLYGFSVCFAAGVIVVASVNHSHSLHHGPIAGPPALSLPGQGIGAASAVHPAAPASTPAPVGQNSRGRSAQRSRGRARIAPHAHKAPGVAVPAPDSQN